MATPNGITHVTQSYKLRSSGAMPISSSNFFVQTFGVDENDVTSYEGSTQLPDTYDFTGASVDGNYISANFQRLPYLSSDGDHIFSGKMVSRTHFYPESVLGVH
jgi:hypothetical protein